MPLFETLITASRSAVLVRLWLLCVVGAPWEIGPHFLWSTLRALLDFSKGLDPNNVTYKSI
jgi:hypothetical protein